jgi:hypothetical protein
MVFWSRVIVFSLFGLGLVTMGILAVILWNSKDTNKPNDAQANNSSANKASFAQHPEQTAPEPSKRDPNSDRAPEDANSPAGPRSGMPGQMGGQGNQPPRGMMPPGQYGGGAGGNNQPPQGAMPPGGNYPQQDPRMQDPRLRDPRMPNDPSNPPKEGQAPPRTMPPGWNAPGEPPTGDGNRQAQVPPPIMDPRFPGGPNAQGGYPNGYQGGQGGQGAARPGQPGVKVIRVTSGTCFVVSGTGHLMTNQHVVKSQQELGVYVPKLKRLVPARVIAEDEDGDMALIKISLPKTVKLSPLELAGKRHLKRGEKVAAFGYPLVTKLGAELKLTTGVVSAPASPSTEDMVMLDVRINPGNSGGPLCDAAGNVVGMVTAKSENSAHEDSYGMAIPAPTLDAFLKKHLPGYKPSKNDRDKMPWDEVDTLVSPSILLILNASEKR